MCNMNALSLFVQKLWPICLFPKVCRKSRSRLRGQCFGTYRKVLLQKYTCVIGDPYKLSIKSYDQCFFLNR